MLKLKNKFSSLRVKDETSEMKYLSMALFGAETGTVGEVGQK